MSQQNPVTDREVGIAGIGHGDRFADMRARSKNFDAARERRARRNKKVPREIQASDFVPGDVVDVVYRYTNGRELPGRAVVEDVNLVEKVWRCDGRVFVRWLTIDQEQSGHIFEMQLESGGWHWGRHVRWVKN